jgi:hypothetical protein
LSPRLRTGLQWRRTNRRFDLPSSTSRDVPCCDCFLQSCGAQLCHCHRRMDQIRACSGNSPYFPPRKRYSPYRRNESGFHASWLSQASLTCGYCMLRLIRWWTCLIFRRPLQRSSADASRHAQVPCTVHSCCAPEVRASDSCSLLARGTVEPQLPFVNGSRRSRILNR